jgi:nucleoid DNA-binding protein
MNNKEFIAELANRTGYSKVLTQRLVSDLVIAMSDHFLEGEAISIGGFGVFEVKKKMERIIVNPTTGARMLVPPKLVLGFKASGSLKEKVKSGGANG